MLPSPVLEFKNVNFIRSGRRILEDINWRIDSSETSGRHWALVGRNGSGKTTLLRMASVSMWPTSGEVTVLGNRFGTIDLRELRPQVGWVCSALTAGVPSRDSALEVVASGIPATLGLSYYTPNEEELERSRQKLALFGMESQASQEFHTMSQGEQQKVLVARALLPEPGLMILDEPFVGLDMYAREELVTHLEKMSAEPTCPAMILVTHHIEEIPAAFSNAAVLKQGHMIACGKTGEVFTDEILSMAFDLPLKVSLRDNRYWARITVS